MLMFFKGRSVLWKNNLFVKSYNFFEINCTSGTISKTHFDSNNFSGFTVEIKYLKFDILK